VVIHINLSKSRRMNMKELEILKALERESIAGMGDDNNYIK
jgi:hypothetical protein